MKKFAIAFAIGFLAIGAAVGAAYGQLISAQDAMERALALTGGGAVNNIELVSQAGDSVYRIVIVNDAVRFDVLLNANTGAVLNLSSGNAPATGATVQMPQQPATGSVLSAAQVSFERAVEIAFSHAGGGILKEIELQFRQGRPAYDVEIVRAGREYDIRIDAISGAIIRSRNSSASRTPAGLTQVTSARVASFAQTALNRTGGGTVTEVEWERSSSSGIEYIEFEIRQQNGSRRQIRIDVATGNIIRDRQRS